MSKAFDVFVLLLEKEMRKHEFAGGMCGGFEGFRVFILLPVYTHPHGQMQSIYIREFVEQSQSWVQSS